MLRAAGIASGRKLELRVVALPEGMDPAELIEREGADALRARVERSVPFAAFQVDRILAGADAGSAEGRDRAVAELAPVLAELPPSVLREELVRRVAGRLDLSQARLAALLSGAGADLGGAGRPAGAPGSAGSGSGPGDNVALRPGGGPAGPGRIEPLDTSERAERRFLAVCVALPEAGAAALAAVDPDILIRSGRLRRAARHLSTHTAAPLADLPPDDEELARTIADLVAHAGRAGRVTAERIEHERLVLERLRIERAIRLARVEGRPGIGELARQREQVMAEIHEVITKLEQTG
jgi:DNA primase